MSVFLENVNHVQYFHPSKMNCSTSFPVCGLDVTVMEHKMFVTCLDSDTILSYISTHFVYCCNEYNPVLYWIMGSMIVLLRMDRII